MPGITGLRSDYSPGGLLRLRSVLLAMPGMSQVDENVSKHSSEDGLHVGGGRLGRFIRNLEYLYKWLVLGIIIGVVAGLGAVAFYLALRCTTGFLLGYVAGYHMPTALVEGGRPGSSHYQRPWALPLVTTGRRAGVGVDRGQVCSRG